MISREVIQKIAEAAVQAPSGSNSQPWRFEVTGTTLDIFMMPEKDHPVLNVKGRGTILATGCAIENIAVAAGHYGIGTEITLFPDAKNNNFVARIILKDREGSEELELFNAIWKRATNRKPYQVKGLPADVGQRLLAIPAGIAEYDVVLRMTEDRGQIRTLAGAASANEIILFENEQMHKLFFEELVWTEREEHEKKSGLYLKTMELKAPQALALKLFRSWPMMKFLDGLGAARRIAKENAAVYEQCASYGGLIIGDDDKAFVGAGRVIQRVWLTATSLGLSFHLQTGINFFAERLEESGIQGLSEEHRALITQNYKAMAAVFAIPEGKLLPAIFRIGYGGEPSARSSRKPPEVIFKA